MTREFELQAGRLCLNFINTVDQRPTEDVCEGEFLTQPEDLDQWIRQAQFLDRAALTAVSRKLLSVSSGKGFLRRAIAVREKLYRVLLSCRPGGIPQLEQLNELLVKLPRPKLEVFEDRILWHWPTQEGNFADVLAIIVHDATDLVLSESRQRIKICAAEDCGWLFLDTSKNSSRRWCSMGDCGNRAKARAFYNRSR